MRNKRETEMALTRKSMLEGISDLSKDALGFRLRKDFAAMSLEELTSEWEYLNDELDRTMKREREDKAKAEIDFENEVAECIALGAPAREDALRWMMNLESDDWYDVDHWAWNRGLLFSKDILAELNEVWKYESRKFYMTY